MARSIMCDTEKNKAEYFKKQVELDIRSQLNFKYIVEIRYNNIERDFNLYGIHCYI